MATFNFDAFKACNFLINSDSVVQTLFQISTTKNVRFEHLKSELKQTLSHVLGNVEVHYFGSRVIGVGTLESDLDIYIDIGGNFNSGYKFTSQDEVDFVKIKAALEPHKWLVQSVIRKTVVPILKTTYLDLNLQCDISISNGVSVRNSELLKHLFYSQPEAIKLVHFVMKWMESQGVEDFKRYAVTVLVLFYLQQKKLMPSLKIVHCGLPIKRVAGWETQFDPNRSMSSYNIQIMRDYKDYARDFFTFYSEFNFDNVISAYYGYQWELAQYVKSYPKFEPSAISIAGPINREQVCARISETEKVDFVKLCKASSDFLASRIR